MKGGEGVAKFGTTPDTIVYIPLKVSEKGFLCVSKNVSTGIAAKVLSIMVKE